MDIRQRVFDKKGKLKGILYADLYFQPPHSLVDVIKKPNRIYTVGIGYAIQHPIDKMDKTFALNVAAERSWKWIKRNKNWIDIPPSIRHDLYNFTRRCEKYYKVNDRTIVFADWIYNFFNEYIIANIEVENSRPFCVNL